MELVTDSHSGAGSRERTGIPFFTQSRGFEQLWPHILENLDRVFDNGKYSHGAQVAELEERLAIYTGARYVVGVNSGTDALVLLLRAAGLRPGDGVVVPAFSFVATASAPALAGGVPQFADIDPVTYAMDAGSMESAVTARSRFAMPAHLFCQMADMVRLESVCSRRGLTMLEDSAEAIGMRLAGIHAGLHGRGGVLSFFPSKTLGALGDAGAVLTDDPAIAELVSALRHHGRGGRTVDNFPGISHETEIVGMNSKMDDIQAAVLLAKLARLDEDIARRGELAAAYSERLSGMAGIVQVPTTASHRSADRSVFYVYLVEVEKRDDLVEFLAGRGIETETYYPTPLPMQPCFANLGYRRGQFPHAEAACARAVALPLYPDLTVDEVDRVCETIAEFYLGSSLRQGAS